MSRYLFVTGKLAAEALHKSLEKMEPDFDYELAVLPISVAALSDTQFVAKNLNGSQNSDVVMIPGLCQGDLAVIADKVGVQVVRGPKDLKDIPVIMVTTYQGEDEALSEFKQGAKALVYKDRLAVLAAAVRRVVQEKLLRDARTQAELALRAANQVLTALIRCAPLPITVIDRNGTINVWNPAAEDVLGWSKEEMLGRRLSEVLGGNDGLAAALERSLSEGGAIGVETREERKDGASVDLRLYSSPLTDSGGQVQGVVGILTDVTERNLILEAFRESKERFQSAFVYAPIGMGIASLEGRILRVNPAFCKMLGYSETELVRMSWEELIHPEDRHRWNEAATPAELRLVHRDGGLVYVQWNTSLVRDSEGKPQYQICQAVDITERKQAEEKIRRYAAELRLGLVGLSKERDYTRPNQVLRAHLIGEVEDHDILVVDDIIDTAGSMVAAVEELKENAAYLRQFVPQGGLT